MRLGQSCAQSLVQLGQGVHFNHAMHQNGERVFAVRVVLAHQGVHGVQPLGGEAEIQMGQIGQGQKRVHDLGVDGSNLEQQSRLSRVHQF